MRARLCKYEKININLVIIYIYIYIFMYYCHVAVIRLTGGDTDAEGTVEIWQRLVHRYIYLTHICPMRLN